MNQNNDNHANLAALGIALGSTVIGTLHDRLRAAALAGTATPAEAHALGVLDGVRGNVRAFLADVSELMLETLQDLDPPELRQPLPLATAIGMPPTTTAGEFMQYAYAMMAHGLQQPVTQAPPAAH